MNDPLGEFGRVNRAVFATDTDEHEQAWANLCHDLDTDLNLGFANALNDGSHEFSLDFVLRLKATAVNRIALSAHQHQLTDPNARVNAQRLRGHVTQFQHLTVFNTWLNECAGHVDHQAEAGIATAPFEKPTNIRGQLHQLAGNAVDRFSWMQHIGRRERDHFGVIAIVRVFGNVDRSRRRVDLANFVAKRQVDRRDADLVFLERRNGETTDSNFVEDNVAGKDRHEATEHNPTAVAFIRPFHTSLAYSF